MRLSTSHQIHMLALAPRGSTLPEVQEKIKAGTGRTYTMGQLYTTLERLRIPGLVESEMRDSIDARGRQHPMRYYWLSVAGTKALNEALDQKDVRSMKNAVGLA
jgi:DNA-binding PadR family transcriptional regulator